MKGGSGVVRIQKDAISLQKDLLYKTKHIWDRTGRGSSAMTKSTRGKHKKPGCTGKGENRRVKKKSRDRGGEKAIQVNKGRWKSNEAKQTKPSALIGTGKYK